RPGPAAGHRTHLRVPCRSERPGRARALGRDLLFGARSSAVATLVERHSRFVMLTRLPGGHTADAVASALASAIATLPAQLRRSITWTKARRWPSTPASASPPASPVYFCDPRSPGSAAGWRIDTNAEIPLPPGVHGLIAARLDTLPAERKHMLHDGAVVGKVFWSGAVAEMG